MHVFGTRTLGVRALLALVGSLTLGIGQAASATSATSNFQAFLTMEKASPSLAIGAAQLAYDGVTGLLSIDTTVLGITGGLVPLPYSLHLPGMVVSMGDASDWLSLSGTLRGMGSHLDLDPCAGASGRENCIANFEAGLMASGGTYLELVTDDGTASIAGELRLVPEPGTGVLAGIGLASLAFMGRRRVRI